MAPLRRKKRSGSPSTTTTAAPSKLTTTTTTMTEDKPSHIPASPQRPPQLQPAPAILSNMAPSLSQTVPHLSPAKIGMKTPSKLKSPLRRVNGGGITKAQRQMLIDNLELEINERVRRLRAQYEVQAGALRQRIELRINRIPKKFWTAKMGDLLTQHSGSLSTLNSFTSNTRSGTASGGLNAKSFVEDVRRLSMSSTDSKPASNPSLNVAKKRTKKPAVFSSSQPLNSTISTSTLPPTSSHPLPSPFKSSFSIIQGRPLSPIKQSPVKFPQSPVKRTEPPINSSLSSSDDEPMNGKKPPSRPNSRAAVKSSTNTTSKVTKSSKSSSSKTKSSSRPNTAKGTSKIKQAPLGDTNNPGGLPQQALIYDEAGNNPSKFVKNIGSNGSFKENGGRPVTADGRPFQSTKTGLGERSGNGNRNGNGNGNGGDGVKEKVEKLEKAEKGAAGMGTMKRTLRNRK